MAGWKMGGAEARLGLMGYSEFVGFMAAVSIAIAIAIDITLPAFDEIKESFGMPPESNSVALTISLYFLGIAVAQVFYGPLADHYGRKPILSGGLILFVLGAAGSTLAPSMEVLLVSRFMWGMGAASPRVLSTSIVRDVFEGDRMARVLSLVMSVFLVGPVVAPLIGEGLLQFASWRVVFGATLAVGIGMLMWTVRLSETLHPAHRMPLGFSRTRFAFRTVLASRATLGYGLALTFVFGILITLLGSTPLIFEAVYGRSGQFAILFSLASAISAAAAYANSRLVERIGANTVMKVSGAGFVVVGTLIAAISVIDTGRPSFWLWYGLVTVIFALVNIFIPTGNALAMEPMGHLAGTASAVVGTLSLLGGTLLGMLIDGLLESSVTPMSIGFLVYGGLAMLSVLWASRSPRAPKSGVA